MEELVQGQGTRNTPISNFFDREDYLAAFEEGKIKEEDMVLVLSIDSAQLYRNKSSDCWIYIWIIYNYSPQLRYKKKHVLPGGFIGGPNKPKHIDSFIFSALYHLSALQAEGLTIWDAYKDNTVSINPFFTLACADGPCMASLSTCIGHHGKVHCHYYCPLTGRYRPGASMYYPAQMKPKDNNTPSCDHPDVKLATLLGGFTVEDCI
ncbi:hypothetical protein PM082_023932 [Marasmius tenuissimus]|nr:hypothetical protein PM082_023932 [Marasmius tenuissimus]